MPWLVRTGAETSPGLSGLTAARIESLMSAGANHPSSPPLDFELSSEYTRARSLKSSPLAARARTISAFFWAAATCADVGLAGHEIRTCESLRRSLVIVK